MTRFVAQGSLPLEAALISLKIAPGSFRNQFAFERWPDFDEKLWQKILQQATENEQKQFSAPISGSDRDPDILQQALTNASVAGLSDQLKFTCQELSLVEAPTDQGVMICNPPYGERLGNSTDLAQFYRLLGDVLKQRFKGWKVYILSGNKALAKSIRLKSSRRIPVWNGEIACQLLEYELY